MTSDKFNNRVAIMGCQDFTAENLYSLLMTGAVRELAIIDKECGETIAELFKLLESVPLGFETHVFKAEPSDAAEADVLVIGGGVRRVKGESGIDLLKRKVAKVREIAGYLKENKFGGVILVASNPVDVLANAVLEESGFSQKRVIGSGKSLRHCQLSTIYDRRGANKHLAVNDIEQNVSRATWCAAISCCSPMIDNCQPNCPEFGKMLDADRRKPIQISGRGDRSPFAAGACVPKICESILRDERTILPVVAMTTGQYGISGVYLNQPCIIRRGGVENIIELRLEDSERRELIDLGILFKGINAQLSQQDRFSSAKTL